MKGGSAKTRSTELDWTSGIFGSWVRQSPIHTRAVDPLSSVMERVGLDGGMLYCLLCFALAPLPCGLNHGVALRVVGFELVAGEGVEIVEPEERLGEFGEVFDFVIHGVVGAGGS